MTSKPKIHKRITITDTACGMVISNLKIEGTRHIVNEWQAKTHWKKVNCRNCLRVRERREYEKRTNPEASNVGRDGGKTDSLGTYK